MSGGFKQGLEGKADVLLCPPETLNLLLVRHVPAQYLVFAWWTGNAEELVGYCGRILKLGQRFATATSIGEIHAWGCDRLPGPVRKNYPPNNWRLGLPWSVLYSAAVRHALREVDGETHDPESGRPHRWHFLCCVSMLYAHGYSNLGENDQRRWTVGEADARDVDATESTLSRG